MLPSSIVVTVAYNEETTGNSSMSHCKLQYAKCVDKAAGEWNDGGTFKYTGKTQEFTISNLETDTFYFVRVKMINDNGESHGCCYIQSPIRRLRNKQSADK